MVQGSRDGGNSVQRRGFTLIELCVSIAVVGLLVAVLIPAVSSVRESARRAECQNRVHQVTVGAQHYAASRRGYPRCAGSFWWQLFPYLELGALKEQLENLTWTFDPVRNPDLSAELLVCPSDELVNPAHGHISYLMNDGTSLTQSYLTATGESDGVLTASPQEVTDGLSNTAMFAEHLIHYRAAWRFIDVELFMYPQQYSPDQIGPIRFAWYLNASPRDPTEFREQCRATTAGHHPIRYHDYTGWNGWGGYRHLMEPNSRSCYPGRVDDAPYIVREYRSTTGVVASSRHTGGVNVGMCDGHLRFVSDAVDINVWRAAGTRNGQESAASLR